MRVLIVGCGYVGLPLGAELARQGHEVFGLRQNVGGENDLRLAGIHPLVGDITKPDDLSKLPGPFEWVVNCAASRGGGAEDYRRVYLLGTHNLIKWLATAPPEKYVYTSSTSVYGQNDGSVVTESSPAEPVAETARVLVETETTLLAAARQKTLPAVILRVAGIYGPGRGYWFKQFLNNEARLEGGGGRILNMIHRDDVVGCVIAALRRGRPGVLYNAVDDEPVTQLVFFQWLANRLRRPLPPSESADSGANRKRGATNKVVSNQKLNRELRYHFRYPSFREGYTEELARLGLEEKPDKA